jgi:hypothetical protein
MNKLLYSQSTQQVHPYPRNDGQPIIGLDPDYLVLTEVLTPPPTDYNTETQSISDSWNVDVDSLEYRQEWTVADLLPSPPVPNWDRLYAALMNSEPYQFALLKSTEIPNLASALSVVIDSIQYGIMRPDSQAAMPAFQSAVSLLMASLASVNQSFTLEQLAEVRAILDANNFQSVLLG